MKMKRFKKKVILCNKKRKRK